MKLRRILLTMVATVLLGTATMKLLSLRGPLPWNGAEPLTGLEVRTVLLWSSLAEISICVGIALLPATWKGWLVAMTGFQFLLYHWALWRIGYHGHCPCFGRFWKTLGGDWHVTVWLAAAIFAAGVAATVLAVLEERRGKTAPRGRPHVDMAHLVARPSGGAV